MRADEPITSSELWDMDGCGEVREYINQLRVERLMAKADYFYERARPKWGHYSPKESYRLVCISKAYEARAKRIKEEYNV